MASLATDDYWIDAGQPSLYLRANLDLAAGRLAGGDEPAIASTAMVDPTARCLDSVVGPGAAVSSGASVTASVILPGAVVGERATVVDSIIAGHVGAGAAVSGSVIGAGYRVADGATVADEVLPPNDKT
jgi:mannose-1-phosphate guanylyltransferase